MSARARIAKPAYPGKVVIRHAVQAARDNGLDVAGITISPDGTVHVMEARALPQQPETLFDTLVSAGRL